MTLWKDKEEYATTSGKTHGLTFIQDVRASHGRRDSAHAFSKADKDLLW